MAKRSNKFSSLFQPGDLFILLVVLIGIFIAIFLNGIAIKLIGVSVVVLAILAFFMLISQRYSETVESGKFNYQVNKPNFQVTVKKDPEATRKTIENFEKPDQSTDIGESIKDVPAYMGTDEGFRIVSKSAKLQEIKNKQKTESATSAEEPELKINYNEIIEEAKPAAEPEIVESPIVEEPAISEEKANIETEQKIEPVEEKINIEEVPKAGEIVESTALKAEEKPVQDNIFDVLESHGPEQENINNESVVEEIKTEIIEAPAVIEEVNVEEPVAIEKEAPVEENAAEELIKAEVKQSEPVLKPIAEIKYVAPIVEEAVKPVVPTKEEIVEEKPDYKEKPLDMPLTLLMEDDPIIGKEPRMEFEFFLSRVLLIVRSVISARTVSFVLVNPDKNELILESYVTNVPDAITQNVKLPISNDIVSQIVKNAKPEILTDINPSAELDLIPYYAEGVGTSSFVGVPAFYNKSVIGILCADSEEVDAYDSASVGFLGQFTKILSALVQSYTEKWDLIQASKTLDAINKFTKIASSHEHQHTDIGEDLVETVSSMFEYTNIGIVMFDEERGAWYITSYKSTENTADYILREPVDLENTIAGDSLINCKTVYVTNIPDKAIRINPKEPGNRNGFFAAVPVKSLDNTYGVLFVEGKNTPLLSPFDLSILETLADSAGANIEKMHLLNLLQTNSYIDPGTGILNSYAFVHRLEQELSRMADFNVPITLCLFSVDKYASFSQDHPERFEKVNNHIIGLVNKYIRNYDLFGKINPSTFAVLLIGVDADQTKIWAEKVRNAAAISVIEIEQKRFTATLSIGIYGASNSDNTNMLLNNCNAALMMAQQKTNSVQVYH